MISRNRRILGWEALEQRRLAAGDVVQIDAQVMAECFGESGEPAAQTAESLERNRFRREKLVEALGEQTADSVLLHLEGLSYRKIGELLNVSHMAVKRRVDRFWAKGVDEVLSRYERDDFELGADAEIGGGHDRPYAS